MMFFVLACAPAVDVSVAGSPSDSTGETAPDAEPTDSGLSDDSADSTAPDTGETLCEVAPGVLGEDVELSMEWEGRTRTYSLHIPADYDCTPRPLLIGLHYYTGTATNFLHETAMIADFLDEEGVIGLFPNAMARGEGPDDDWVTAFNDLSSHNDSGPDGETCTWWSWDYGVFDDCPASEAERTCRWGTSCADDVGMTRALIEQVSAGWTVDADRIHLTGFSQGGIATQTWAAELQDVLASVAPLHGFAANGHTVGPTEGVSMMQVWGVYDIAINGWETSSMDGLIYDGAAETAAVWAQAQGCSSSGKTAYQTVSDDTWGWRCTEHADCETGADVVSCQWDGSHHWGRSEAAGDFMWAAVWEFFEAHPRQ